MKAMLSLRARSAAAPRADETFETLAHGVGDTARDEAAGRVAQFNIRVAAWVKKRMYELKKAERATYGELMEAMVAAYETRGASLKDGVAPVDEARKGRLREVKFWSSEGVHGAIGKVAAAREMSVSSLIEEWLAQEVRRLDPHGVGKFGVLVQKSG